MGDEMPSEYEDDEETLPVSFANMLLAAAVIGGVLATIAWALAH